MGDAPDYTVTIDSSDDYPSATVYGIHPTSGNANGATVTMDGGTVGQVVGGFLTGAAYSAANNTVTIKGGQVGDVTGGKAQASNNAYAINNTVTISGSAVVTGDVTGGHAVKGMYSNAAGNTVTLAGGEVQGTVYGGRCDSIYTLNCGESYKKNTLNVQGASLNVGGIQNFNEINFTLPAGIKDGDAVLTVNGDADFSSAAVGSFAVDGVPALRVEDTITLIKVTGNVTPPATPLSTCVTVGGYTFDLNYDDSSKTLFAKVTSAPTPGAGTDPGTGGGYSGGDSSSPTMGELGLLLSGLALAGAAAPALRRRERKARKQD